MIDTLFQQHKMLSNDPLNTHRYTLANGLKVFLTVNRDQPRIYTAIAFNAGSKNDPADTTGLAHYMEHMLFKGTRDFGTTDWDAEKVLLDKIEELYEVHLTEEDPEKKKEIYKEIDVLSYEAAKIAIPNEYDKMVSTLGATETNAYTAREKTVYLNNIPANELDKWLRLEANRFDKIVLRQFHTELETVYEEFNRTLDNDFRKSWKSLYEGLFETHPYRIPIIGLGEDLKSPSMRNIYRFYEQYYRPNNAALMLSGDLEPEETIELINKHFGGWEAGEIPLFNYEKEAPINEVRYLENKGSQTKHLYMAYRFSGTVDSIETAMMLRLISQLLHNDVAGIMDINLIQQQKVLQIASYEILQKDYSSHVFFGLPRKGQSLDEVKELILAQIEVLKKGEWEEWMLDAVITQMEYDEQRAFRSNQQRVSHLIDCFSLEIDYEFANNWKEYLSKITKADVIAFAQEHYKDNYVITYKKEGIDNDIPQVDKPPITAIPINRDSISDFFNNFKELKSPRLSPRFLDFDKDVKTDKVTIGGRDIPFTKIKNDIDQTFGFYLIWDFGDHHHKDIALAFKYLPYLGTDLLSPKSFQEELFKYGLEIKAFAHKRKAFIFVTGLERSLEKGLEILNDLLSNVVKEVEAYQEIVQNIAKKRADQRLSKETILHKAMSNYAIYGSENPFRDVRPIKELADKNPSVLIDLIKKLTDYPFDIFFYGNTSEEEVKTLLAQKGIGNIKQNLLTSPSKKDYTQLETTEDKVLFFEYEQTQVELMLMSKKMSYDKNLLAPIRIFNEYFGSGLSSIVFQELREAKALAYSAYSVMTLPAYVDTAHFIKCYIGTQPDKLKEAVNAFLELMNEMPEAQEQFDAAKLAALKKIESKRIVHENIYWQYANALDFDQTYDIRKDIYKDIKNLSLPDLKSFFNEHIKGSFFNYLVIGKKELLDFSILEKLGPIKELSIEDVFED